MELCCGPLGVTEVQEEIPFLCSMVRHDGAQQIGVMYGVGCRTDDDVLWRESKIRSADLDAWIADSILSGVYSPGDCDLFIFDHDRLTVRLCHESDIHIETTELRIISECTIRWLAKGFRILRKHPSSCNDWKQVKCLEDAISALEGHE